MAGDQGGRRGEVLRAGEGVHQAAPLGRTRRLRNPSTNGAPGGNRTPDLDVRTVLLYPLSYGGESTRLRILIQSALRAPCGRGGTQPSLSQFLDRVQCRASGFQAWNQQRSR